MWLVQELLLCCPSCDTSVLLVTDDPAGCQATSECCESQLTQQDASQPQCVSQDTVVLPGMQYWPVVNIELPCRTSRLQVNTHVFHRTHVDAAYAGATAVLPSMRHWFDGVELTDSFSFNPHKWLLTNFDCAALWVADSGPLKTALSLTPAFLKAKGNALDYKVVLCLSSV